ncbi:MAG: pyridoxal phosphate-dependent decarboxylase family protein [Blastocatellia bacterium]
MTETAANGLGDMPAEDFRAYGHQLIDWIADFLANVGDQPAFPNVQPGDIRAKLPASPPIEGEAMEEILADVDRVIMPGMAHWNHPRFFAYFTSSGSAPGILGELLGAALNANNMLWQSCPAATELEQVTLDWLRQMIGLPPEFFGIIYDGGSSSTFHAIAAAREQAAGLNVREHGLNSSPRLRIYTSEQGHSSIDKAAMALGLGLDSVRRVEADDEYRMIPQSLAGAIAEDRRAGVLPFCVVATAGSTSCTSIDPIPAIADVCECEGLWLHVDAAHGGAAAIVPELRHVLDGCDRADSIVVNPHKWLFVQMGLSALYTRKPDALRRAFSLTPEYLRTAQGDEAVNFMDYGIPLGRNFRALKLWFTLRYFGVEGIAARIREHIKLAGRFAEQVDAHPDFERLAPVPLSTVCFRAHPRGLDDEDALNDLNERLMRAINQTGEAFLSHTKLRGRYTIRLVISHLRVNEDHVNRVWEIAQERLRALMKAEKWPAEKWR